MHLDLGCNSLTSESAEELFTILTKQQSLTSISIANVDCYKNKNKIGVKGAQALGNLIATNHLMTIVNLADNSLSGESLYYIMEGVKKNPYMVSLNLG